jgi:D-beta-D-heptose 7-phosphate kinase/D-beta-D-heptose 1-phosphate adenosyltransferase
MNIWVNGCFDILHVGHLNLLEYAKNLVDPKTNHLRLNRLIVGIDSDRRVKELKGGNRPINNQEDRKRMLEALACVDEVVIYDSKDQLCDYIQLFDIDYMVIGEDYKIKGVLCREFSKNDVIFYSKDERSSTNIIEKIKNA